MPRNLEYPGAGGVGDWDSLYRARGDDVQPHRSVFTGDAFIDVEVQGVGETTVQSVMVLQHPCALRHDGVNLQPRLIVAELREHPIIPPHEWTKHFRKMPLPELIPTDTAGTRNQAAFFSDVYLASPDALAAGTRVACLSQTGVNLLVQRWVHHNSRVVVPTWQYQEVTSAAFEEADLIEEWCDDQVGTEVSIQEATVEAMKWLRENAGGGVMRQAMLDNPQNRSTVRKEMRAKLRSLHG